MRKISIMLVVLATLMIEGSFAESQIITLRDIREELLSKINSSPIQVSRGSARDMFYHNELDVRSMSKLTVKGYERILAGTGLEGLGKYYVEYESKYGVNGVQILAITILESGWGNSSLAVEKNNLSGYMAYDNDPFNSAYHFQSKGESIEATFKLISIYTKDGLYSLSDIGKRYASDPKWASKVVEILTGL